MLGKVVFESLHDTYFLCKKAYRFDLFYLTLTAGTNLYLGEKKILLGSDIFRQVLVTILDKMSSVTVENNFGNACLNLPFDLLLLVHIDICSTFSCLCYEFVEQIQCQKLLEHEKKSKVLSSRNIIQSVHKRTKCALCT